MSGDTTGRSTTGVEGFPGWWCGRCRGPLGSHPPTHRTCCPRCGAFAYPLDERMHAAMTEAGLDEDDATTAVAAVFSVVTAPVIRPTS